MTRKSLTEFNTSPYYDDFNDDKSFLKVLFKPGIAIQARELNQIQSIITDQISKFGDHIFKDGSPVLNGNFNIDVNVKYIKLHDSERGGIGDYLSTNSYIEKLEGRTLTSSRGVKFLVRKVEKNNSTEPNTLIGVYKSGGIEVQEGELLNTEPVEGLENYSVTTAILDISSIGGVPTIAYSQPVTGNSSIASVDDGIFYVSGFFTKCLNQSIILDKYGNTPSYRVGLEVDESLITSGDDISLYDNAQGSPNFSAPGADRFKTTLILTKKELSQDDGNIIDSVEDNASFEFYEFVRVRNGDKVDQIKNSQYAYLGEELARRTYETNGDFVVKNFVLDIDEYDNPDLSEKLKLTLDPGKAYVKGHEIETISPIEITLDKGRSVAETSQEDVNTFLGNFVYVDMNSQNVSSVQNDLFYRNIKLDVHDSSGTSMGYCRFKQLSFDEGLRLSFFDLNLGSNSTQDIATFNIFNEQGTGQVLFTVVSPSRVNVNGDYITTISNPEKSDLIFNVPHSSIQEVGNVDYTYNKLFSASFSSYTPGAGGDDVGYSEFEISKEQGEQFFFSPSSYIDDSSAVNDIIFYRTDSTNSNYTFTSDELNWKVSGDNAYIKVKGDLSNEPAGVFQVLVRMELDISVNKLKALKSNQSIEIQTSDITFNVPISLKKCDIFRINSIIANDPEGTDMSEHFELDNGQRDSFYDVGSIKLINSSLSFETNQTSITVNFDHFSHDKSDTNSETDIGYFDVDSYSGIDYEDIPIYISKKTGKSYNLSDTIDFRPTVELNEQGEPTGFLKGSRLPHGSVQDRLEVNYKYYLARIDKIALTKDKQFIVLKGASSLSPKTPPDDPDAMSMYIVTVPPYTYNDNDVKVTPIHNRRYTMRDIGILDRKIEELQARSNLRLLQEKTKNVQIRDSAGLEIFKNGILIDDFSGHSVGDVSSSEYRCSIDFDTKELRPSFNSDSYDLEFIESSSLSTDSSGVVKRGPLILSEYSVKEHQIQPLSNKSINVNPHKMSYWFGEIKMNPSSDMWFNQNIDPRVNINDIGENDAWQNLNTSVSSDYGKGFGTQWNDWEVIWTGKETLISSEELNPDQILQNNIGRLRDASTKNYLRDSVDRFSVTGTGIPNRIERSVNNKKVDNSVVPFMRTKEIDFVATNLKPNDNFWAFFDDINVTDKVVWCTKIKPISADASKTFSDGIYDGEILSKGANKLKVLKNLNDGTGSMYVKIMPGSSFSENDTIVSENSSLTIQTISQTSGDGGYGKTDEYGTICGSFTIPSDSKDIVDGVRFRTGQRLFRLINNDENTLSPTETQSTPLSIAENSYTSQGIIEDPENFTSSTRIPLIKRSNICDILSVSRDPLSRELNSLKRCLDWKDPLSQTFVVDLASNRNGIFLESVDLFFKSKDNDLPISIEIRPTSNGFPSTSIVLPFSEVILNSADVNISSGPDSSNYTRFTFDAPVYLKPGEYAIVVKTNGENYELWSGEVGVPVLNSDGSSDKSNRKVTKLPLIGRLYSSHNSGVWEKLNNESLTFRINKCQFNHGNKELKLKVLPPQSSKFINLFKFNVSTLKNFYNLNNPKFEFTFGSTKASFHENRNEEFSTPKTFSSDGDDFQIVSSFDIPESDVDVSPVFDIERMSVIAIENNINSSLRLEPEFESDGVTIKTPKTDVCYISKRVNLDYPYESKDIRVYLDMYKTIENEIAVYYKVGNKNDSVAFDDKSWYQMYQITPNYIYSEYSNDYREFVFGIQNIQLNGFTNFDSYAIKIIMKSSNSSKVPKIRNLRAIALQEPAGV